jgi:hypothetical protein
MSLDHLLEKEEGDIEAVVGAPKVLYRPVSFRMFHDTVERTTQKCRFRRRNGLLVIWSLAG